MAVMQAQEHCVSDKSGFRGITADVAKWPQFSESLSSHRRGGRSAKCTRQKRMLSLIPDAHGERGQRWGFASEKRAAAALGIMSRRGGRGKQAQRKKGFSKEQGGPSCSVAFRGYNSRFEGIRVLDPPPKLHLARSESTKEWGPP